MPTSCPIQDAASFTEKVLLLKKKPPPSGSKESPASAGDMGSTSGPGSHMPRGSSAYATATEPCSRARNCNCWGHKPHSPCFTNKKAPQGEARTPQLEKPTQQQHPAQSEINKSEKRFLQVSWLNGASVTRYSTRLRDHSALGPWQVLKMQRWTEHTSSFLTAWAGDALKHKELRHSGAWWASSQGQQQGTSDWRT